MQLTKKKTMKKQDVKSVYRTLGNLRKWLGVKLYGQPERLNPEAPLRRYDSPNHEYR